VNAVTRLKSILLVLAALLPASATTLEKLSVDQLVQRSTAIVRGRVLDSSAGMKGRVIYTFYKVQVTDTLKGTAGKYIEVAVPGGAYNGLRQTIPGAPKPATGTDYVFFLWQGPSGTNHILGLSQGLFDVKIGADGQVILLRGTTDAQFVDAHGQPVEDTGVRVTLRSLSSKVAAQ
jgi:hypothetical protein